MRKTKRNTASVGFRELVKMILVLSKMFYPGERVEVGESSLGRDWLCVYAVLSLRTWKVAAKSEIKVISQLLPVVVVARLQKLSSLLRLRAFRA